jgi:hypothetical protein
MVRNDVAIVRELFVADDTFPVLLDDLAVQQFPHLRRRAEFSVSSLVMRIFDPLHPEPDQPWPGHDFPAAAGKRLVNWAEFVATKPHDILLVITGEIGGGWGGWVTFERKSLTPSGLLQFLPEGNHVELD